MTELASEPSLHEAGHAAVAERLGVTWDMTRGANGYPDSVIVYGASPRNAAIISVAGCIASSGGSVEVAMAHMGDQDLLETMPYVVDQTTRTVDDTILDDVVFVACSLVREEWARIVELALAWDAVAENGH
jgi:hypothetical protein